MVPGLDNLPPKIINNQPKTKMGTMYINGLNENCFLVFIISKSKIEIGNAIKFYRIKAALEKKIMDNIFSFLIYKITPKIIVNKDKLSL